MRFEVLGPLRVRQDDTAVSIGGSKPKALLGMLLLHPNEPVGVDDLTEGLWDGEPPASASMNLRVYVRTLRRALDPPANGEGPARLETVSPGYLIRVEPGELDLADFQDLDARGRQALEQAETGDAARLWRQALDLWRGRPLADVRGGPRLHAAVVRLEERRLRVAEAWIDAQLALGAHAELVSELRGMVAAEPLHEPLWARLMVALHRAGRTADALAAYGQARKHLVDELGMEPGRQLQRLHRALLRGDAATTADAMVSDGTPLVESQREGERQPANRPAGVEVCPYQGLMPFGTTDAEWFFGRERLVAELVTYLSSQLSPPSLLAVVGPSGSGKSSLLHAGLLPALSAGALPVAKDWPRVVFTPGARPLVGLAEAVASIGASGATPPDPDGLADPHRLEELIRDALGAAPTGQRLVMVVDQLEELFTLCKDERVRQAFVAALSHAAGAGDGDTAPAVVVLGLRADFYGHCIAYPELIPVLSGSQVIVGPMTEGDLRHAIERPAARTGLTLEAGLVDLLLADLGVGPERGARPEPGSLPLLSHALRATWQLRDGHHLTVDGYHKIGGIQGAIATTAEDVYDRFQPGERTIVRQLFTRLVAFGEGTQDTSRRIRHDELLDGRSAAEAGTVRTILDALAQARLIVLSSDTIEVAHEALITRWPRLQQWLTDDREGLRIHRQLTEAAHTWAAFGRDPGALYRGARLAVARQWAERDRHRTDMNALERAFLSASIDLESTEETTTRRRTVRLRQLISAILVLVLVAIAGGAFALRESRRNAAQARVVRSQELARTALGLPATRRPLAMLLAVEAFRTAPTPQARGALAALAPEDGYLDTLTPPRGWITRLAFSPDGDTLAASNEDGMITLWNPAQPLRHTTLTAPDRAGTAAIAFSPDGRILASGHHDGTIILWDLAERSPTATLRVGHRGVRSLAFNPDGSMLASGHNDGTLILWDPAEWTELATLTAGFPSVADDSELPDYVTSVAFSPDGNVLASGSAGGALMLWDPVERTRLARLATESADDATQRAPVTSLAFNHDGTTLAVAQTTPAARDHAATTDLTDDDPVAIWDVRRRALSATVGTAAFETMSTVAFSPDGRTLAMGSSGGVVLADVSGSFADVVPRLRYSSDPVNSMAFSPDGTTLAIDDGGRTVTLLDPSAPQIISDGVIRRFAFSDDGGHLATSGDGPYVELWNAATRERKAAFDSPGYIDGDVAFSPSGEWLGRTAWDLVVLFHVPQEEDYRAWTTLDRPEDTRIPIAGGPRSLGFSAEPLRAFVADSFHEMVMIWPQRGPPSRTRIPELRTATLSPNDDVLATATATGVTLWDFPSMTRLGDIGTFERLDNEPLVAFSDDGTVLATVDRDEVTLWNVSQRTRITAFTEDGPLTGIAIAPDNRTVALAIEDPGDNDRIALWDARARVPIADLPLRTSTAGVVAFSANGTRIAAADRDLVRFWDLNPHRATTRICATLERGLTREQWAEFLPEQPYRATCD